VGRPVNDPTTTPLDPPTRWWSEAFAVLDEVVPGGTGMLFLASVLLAVLIALGWYLWPWQWLRRSGGDRRRRSGRDGARRQRRRFRLGRLRWRWPRWRRRRAAPAPLDDLPPDALPDLPAGVLLLSADQLAAQGRFAEAVRERLRAIVRDLIERAVLPESPGWTVTELARAAATARPALATPLGAAVDTFSEIWYGLRPATAEDDAAMRAHAAAVHGVLADDQQQLAGRPG
jgi:hypothetical protein